MTKKQIINNMKVAGVKHASTLCNDIVNYMSVSLSEPFGSLPSDRETLKQIRSFYTDLYGDVWLFTLFLKDGTHRCLYINVGDLNDASLAHVKNYY